MSSSNAPTGPPRSFRGDSRGQAVQIDFMTAIAITVATLAFVMLVGNMMVGTSEAIDRSTDLTGFRGGDRLVDDVLATGPNEPTVTPACAEAYFNRENSTAAATSCGYTSFDASSADRYLQTSLGISPEYSVNLSVRGDTGVLTGDYDTNGRTVMYTLGPAPPTGDYATTHRQFVFTSDIDTDGVREPYTLYFKVWEH